ncbi:RNA recognition motif domain-containing protein [Treponema saccharophilum]|uniref:RNA recognition motif domain-containing protein n=1 Tax=Treponema saccharophilum TaxID=165 RepID=UPI00386986E2
MKKIYVGNLNFATGEERLRGIFSGFGSVSSVSVLVDKFTGMSRGFAFVEMDDDEDAARAISAVDGTDIDGRKVRVSESVERKSRPRSMNRARAKDFRKDAAPRDDEF